MRPTFPVLKSYHGAYTVSSVVDDRGCFETRFFNDTWPRRTESGIPQSVRDAVDATVWSDVAPDGKAWVEYGSEAVSCVSADTVDHVHNEFIKIITAYNDGEL